MAAKKLILKSVFYTLLLLLLYFLQVSLFSRLYIFGVKPFLFPLIAVCIGLFEGSMLGGVLGLVCGVLCDFAMADSTVMFTIFMPFIGFVVGLLTEHVFARGFPSCLVCSAISLLLCAFLQSFKLLIFIGADKLALLKTGLLQSACSIIFILPIYWTVRTISRRTKAV